MTFTSNRLRNFSHSHRTAKTAPGQFLPDSFIRLCPNTDVFQLSDLSVPGRVESTKRCVGRLGPARDPSDPDDVSGLSVGRELLAGFVRESA